MKKTVSPETDLSAIDALIEAHSLTRNIAGAHVGIDIVAARLTAHGVLSNESLAAYLEATI